MCTDYLDCDSVLIGPVTPAFPQKKEVLPYPIALVANGF